MSILHRLTHLNGLAITYILHDDDSYLPASIASFREAGPVFCFVSKVPWSACPGAYLSGGEPGDWEGAVRTAEEAGAEVILGEWPTELAHRQAAQAHLLEKGFTH